MTTAEDIRRYAISQYILPARQRGQKTVTLTARAIHDGLSLDSRFPAVCDAIDGRKFAEAADIVLMSREGPPQSSTVTWHFHFGQAVCLPSTS